MNGTSSAPLGGEAYAELLHRLSAQSIAKPSSAYRDVPWDDPGFRIDPDDPLWLLPDSEPLSRTAWYRAQPSAVRTRLGLSLAATFMKVGIQFESVLKRGLLEFALTLPNRSPEFHYAYHEVAEETQHSLMFQEFVDRSGFDPPGVDRFRLSFSRGLVERARDFPELFFLAVLAGEEPIDHVQRSLLHGKVPLPAVLQRIMRIHVTEEARHLCFARHYLRRTVPELSRGRLLQLQLRTPLLLRMMSQLMLRTSPEVVRSFGIPRAVYREAYVRNPLHTARTVAAVRETRVLCEELGVLSRHTAPLWRALGLLEAR